MDSNGNQLERPSVVVTRAESQSTELIEAIHELGFKVIARPALEITVPDDQGASLRRALQTLSNYEWVILTSTNGVSEFVKASKELDIQTYPKIAVIGSATEKALNNLGLTAILSPHQHVAESLLEIFPSPERNNNVLLSVAAKSRELLPTTLAERGWNVLVVHSYKSIRPKQFQPFDNDEENAEFIIFTSPSTVINFIEMYGKENIPKQIISIGPVTSEEVKKNNLKVCREANPHDSSGILQCLKEFVNPM